jgi:hypothetical protein
LLSVSGTQFTKSWEWKEKLSIRFFSPFRDLACSHRPLQLLSSFQILRDFVSEESRLALMKSNELNFFLSDKFLRRGSQMLPEFEVGHGGRKRGQTASEKLRKKSADLRKSVLHLNAEFRDAAPSSSQPQIPMFGSTAKSHSESANLTFAKFSQKS